ASEQQRRAYPRLPWGLAVQPIVGGRGVLDPAGKTFLRPLDHAALAALASDEGEDHRTCDRHGLEPALGLAEILAGLEHLAQQMVRRAEADRPGAQRVDGEVVGPQPRLAGAAPKRRLVDGGREPALRTGGQRARVAGPCNVDELAGGAAHVRDLDVTAEPRERPVERAGKPRHAVLLAGNRAAAPLIRAVEKPDAGKAERGGHRFELGDVRRIRALKPTAGAT